MKQTDDTHQSRLELGCAYERYIGFVLEHQKWEVIYRGILRGPADRGRDLICTKGKTRLIVQCKRLQPIRQVEREVLVKFETSLSEYKRKFPDESQARLGGFDAFDAIVKGKLYTTSTLTAEAKRIAFDAGIAFEECFSLKNYPPIKCPKPKPDNSAWYYLPSDYAYDSIRMRPWLGDEYIFTQEEAKKMGFVHATPQV
ncbi:MAG: hypothetical protein NTY01_13555 [Verrucomicrobia bacterium]|nr:hypothetical protein [Verrucomicrobiota bacterium]